MTASKLKMTQFAKRIQALNQSYFTFIQTQILSNDTAVLTQASQDYLDFATQLEERYLGSYGEVLTFGSGDCGQLAHGVIEDEDLMVKYPRIVKSLRDKKVCFVACGGLHNAVVTEMVRTSGTLLSSTCLQKGNKLCFLLHIGRGLHLGLQ